MGFGATIVVGCVAALVLTAGGVAPALYAISAVSTGIAAPIGGTAATIAAGATIGSSMALGGEALNAALSSQNISEFNARGSLGTIGRTAIGTGLGVVDGFMIEKDPSVTIGIIKPSNKPKSKGYLGVKYSYKIGPLPYQTKKLSFELHSPHKSGPHQQWHWQKNKWNPITDSITGKSKQWTIAGRRF